MAYLSLADFKMYLSVTRDTDLGDDTLLQAALDAATSQINETCARTFTVAGAATVRRYAPTGTGMLHVDDCTTVTSITFNGTLVDPTTYQLEPVNQIAPSGEWRPYSRIRRYLGWWLTLMPGQATITVTATWGWLATPPAVIEATKILAKDVAKSREVAFGIAGFTDYAGIRVKPNQTVEALLAPYRRVESFGIG